MGELVGQLAVVRQDERTFSVEVEATDGLTTLGQILDEFENPLAAAGAAAPVDEAPGLVVK